MKFISSNNITIIFYNLYYMIRPQVKQKRDKNKVIMMLIMTKVTIIEYYLQLCQTIIILM